MTIVTYVPQKVVQEAAMITWTTGLGAITANALAERDGVNISVAQERLDQAVRLGHLEEQSILVGYPILYSVTLAGRKLARKHADAGGYTCLSGINKGRVSIKNARHLIACASVAAALERRYPDHRLCGELELRKDEREQGSRLINVEIQGQSRTRFHSPDMVMWPPSTPGESPPLPIAVEVELTPKGIEELTAICRGLARCRSIEATLYFVETTKIEKKLLKVIEELKAEDMIVVNPLSEIVESLPGFDLYSWEADD